MIVVVAMIIVVSGVPGVPLEVLQEEMKMKAISGLFASPSMSVEPSIPSPNEEVDIIYNCAMNIPSRMDKKRLIMLRDKYQIPNKVNPHLVALGEWCCTPNSPRVGIYEAYLLWGLRLPLNAFARELLHRLGIGPN